MSKFTPWFPGNVKPVRVGVYQRQYNCPPTNWFCYWDGKLWGCAEKKAKDADPAFMGKSFFPEKPWRGLAEKPE